MLLEADCIPCILRMAVAALRQLPLDENTIRELSTEILEIPALRGLDWNTTSAGVIEDICRKKFLSCCFQNANPITGISELRFINPSWPIINESAYPYRHHCSNDDSRQRLSHTCILYF